MINKFISRGMLSASTMLLTACPSAAEQPNVVFEAPDFTPIGESIKLLGLCLLGAALLIAVAGIFRGPNPPK